jgi:hypothetical protein
MITHILHFDWDNAELSILFVVFVFVVGPHRVFISLSRLLKVVSVPFELRL